MGGTASPLGWCMAYDPIVEGLTNAVGCDAPTYVDDLAGLVRGAGQGLRASFYLVFASWMAGLEVSTHQCQALRFGRCTPELATACAALPVHRRETDGGACEVSGLPLPLLSRLLARYMGAAAHRAEEVRYTCRCALKTALVPAAKHAEWQTIMRHSPFGEEAVRSSWPYLGAAVVSTEVELQGHGETAAGRAGTGEPGERRPTPGTQRTLQDCWGGDSPPTARTGDPPCPARLSNVSEGPSGARECGTGRDETASAPTSALAPRWHAAAGPGGRHVPLHARCPSDSDILREGGAGDRSGSGGPCLGTDVPLHAQGGTVRQSESQARWHADMLRRIAEETWEKATGKAEQRAAVIAAAAMSMGRRSKVWNAYEDSLIPYPAHVIPPTPATSKRLEEAQRLALQPGQVRWCPVWAITALGPYFSVKGAPRCTRASAAAAGIMSFVQDHTWGPAQAVGLQQGLWEDVVRWAHAARIRAPEQAALPPPATRAATAVRRIADARALRTTIRIPRSTAGALYVAAWHHTHAAKMGRWLGERSRGRRWAPGQGQEWTAITHAATVTDACRMLRLLANGLPGRARWRGSEHRRQWTCYGCGNGDVSLAWCSPRAGADTHQEGKAWCQSCLRLWADGDNWALLPEGDIPACLRPRARELRRQRGHLAGFCDQPSAWGACPLCGHGEAGAEHLWRWCPAAAAAWHQCAGGESSWHRALSGETELLRMLAVVASQVVFLYNACLGAPPLQATVAMGRICKAVRATTDPVLPPAEAEESDDGNESSRRPAAQVTVWAHGGGCGACRLHGMDERLVQGAATRRLREPTRADTDRRAPILLQPLQPGRVVAQLHSENSNAAWMVAGRGWWPPPRAVADAQANAEWITGRCATCRLTWACLVMRQAAAERAEVTVPRTLTPTAGAAICPIEISFDGSTKQARGARASGAGSAAWVLGGRGPPRCVARAVLALPDVSAAPEAEAQAGGLALELLNHIARARRRGTRPAVAGLARAARLVGDCVPVVRYGAAQARLRHGAHREPIDEGMRQAGANGWSVEWQAVRRAHNTAAHDLASAAATWAHELQRAGDSAPRLLVVWEGEQDPGVQGLRLPAWP